MTRKPATADNITPGATIYRGKYGRVPFTVTGLDRDPLDPAAQPLVEATGPKGGACWFALHEITVDLDAPNALAEAVIAKRVAEIEAVAEAAEPEIEEPEEFVGEVEPTCSACLYTSGHTSWCPNSPVAGLSGEIRTDESGVARYWTAEEIRALREQEAAQRADSEPAEVAAYLAGAEHVRLRREAARLVEDGLPAVAAAIEVRAMAEELTPAHILAAATGHPSGAAIRARYTR